MYDHGEVTTADTSPPPPRHGAMGNYVRNIAISLAVLILPLVALVAFCTPRGDDIKTIDPSGTYQAAKSEADFDVRIPSGLPDGWRATTSSLNPGNGGVVTLRVSYLTPSGKVAQLVQSDIDSGQLLPAELGGGKYEGDADVAGARWQRYGGRRPGETALVLLEPESSVLVVGDAPLDELRTLASSLR